MTIHRAINLALALLIVILMAYVGPRLDEATCMIGACGVITFGEDLVPSSLWERCALWIVLTIMVLCTLIVAGFSLGFLAVKMGWL